MQRVVKGAVLRAQVALIQIQGGTISRDASDHRLSVRDTAGVLVLRAARQVRDGEWLVEYNNGRDITWVA